MLHVIWGWLLFLLSMSISYWIWMSHIRFLKSLNDTRCCVHFSLNELPVISLYVFVTLLEFMILVVYTSSFFKLLLFKRQQFKHLQLQCLSEVFPKYLFLLYPRQLLLTLRVFLLKILQYLCECGK